MKTTYSLYENSLTLTSFYLFVIEEICTYHLYDKCLCY